MTQAYAEDRRPGLGRGPDHRHGDAGSGGRAGAGGEQHPGDVEVGELLDGDGVVAADDAAHTQLAQVLDEVVDEAVEVVDDEDGPAHVLKVYTLSAPRRTAGQANR